MFSFSKSLIASSAAGAVIGTPSRSLLISRVSNRKTRSPSRSSYTKSRSGWPAISVSSVSAILPIAGRSTWLHRNVTDTCVPLPGAESRMTFPPVCSAAWAKAGFPAGLLSLRGKEGIPDLCERLGIHPPAVVVDFHPKEVMLRIQRKDDLYSLRIGTDRVLGNIEDMERYVFQSLSRPPSCRPGQ